MEQSSSEGTGKPDRTRSSKVLPRIHTAATELFGERGVSGTTTREIALRAGVAEGALYRHYRSKEALARQLFQQHLQTIEKRLRKAVAPHDTMAERMRAFVADFFDLCETDPPGIRMALLSASSELRDASSATRQIPVLRELLSEGAASGELAGDSLDLEAAAVGGMLLGVAEQRLAGAIAEDLREHTTQVALACLRTVGARTPSTH